MATTTRIIEDTFYGGLSVASFTVTVGGSGYTSEPTVVVAAPPSGGGQATATATIVGGIVTAVTITDPGSNYILAPIVSFTGGGVILAVATAVMTTNAPSTYSGNTIALVNFDDHALAVTIDASTMLGGSNGTEGFQKYTITALEWSLSTVAGPDLDLDITFTGSGVTDAIYLANGNGKFNSVAITNAATQPGDATNADVVLTPGGAINGFVLLRLKKEAFV